MARPSPRTRGYDTRWDRARAAFLARHPHCVTCAEAGRVTPARHVHHSTPHRGDRAIFWDRSRWVPLCTEHHNRDAQQVETRGYASRIGRDGLPTDPNHPFNAGSAPGHVHIPDEVVWPVVRASAIPVTLVCGPPAGGKSTYVAEHRCSSDIVIDLDDIVHEMGDPRSTDRTLRMRAMRERNRRLIALASYAGSAHRAWFITGAPIASTRRRWARMLGADETILVLTPETECIERVDRDLDRSMHRSEQVEAIKRWWRDYTPSRLDRMADRGWVESRSLKGSGPHGTLSLELVPARGPR